MTKNPDLSALDIKRFRFILLLTGIVFLCGLVIGYLTVCQPPTDQRLTYKYTTYWACIDGCSNMLEVQYGTLNESLHPLQTECDNRCEEQYWRG